MIRTILSVAAGFIIAGWVVESGSAKKFREVAAEKASKLKEATCENAAKVKSATQKAAAAVREEFSKQEDKAEETTN
jgi:hypothetical protein